MFRKASGLAVFATTLGLLAAGRGFLSYTNARPILEEQRDRLPDELKNADDARWRAWTQKRDKDIRARLAQGDLDSMVNLLLLGTSFTRQPRIRMEALTEASKSGILRARVDDLVAGLRRPGDNERLLFLSRVVRGQGLDLEAPDGPKQTGVFILNNLQRVIQERRMLAERAAEVKGPAQPDEPASLLDRSSFFHDRGLSLDTSILPEFTIDRTLRDLKKRGVLREGQVTRVAVMGPGLDFIDKNEESAFDYYPQQTLQPFALYDSLVGLGLAKSGALSLAIFDISPRVIDHVQRARERAGKNNAYVIQLPRDVARPWPADLIAYWHSIGDRTGTPVEPVRPPEIFPGLEARAVRIRPDVVLACEAADLNIVLERLDLAAPARFDLMVGTNIFVYYDAFEQALALENAGAMLKHGGLLLTNDRLPETRAGSMRLAGTTVVPFDTPGVSTRQAIGWYMRQ